ncbi:MAG TPA: hypothetical protein VHS97_23000 [Isosphaeraceae bacterium]|nr:hypothetical protein [Isosphaeraceae bacterium]
MTLEPERLNELPRLLEALCEERITPEEAARLEALVLADPRAEALYITYLTMQADLAREIGGHHAAAAGGGRRCPARRAPGPGAGPAAPVVVLGAVGPRGRGLPAGGDDVGPRGLAGCRRRAIGRAPLRPGGVRAG